MKSFPTATVLLLVPASLCTSCTGDGDGIIFDGPSGPVPLSQAFPIDGEVNFDDLPAPQSITLEFLDDLGEGAATAKLTTLRWAVTNDDRDIYFAFEWDDVSQDNVYDPDTGPLDFDGIELQIDVDGDGLFSTGEDLRQVFAASASSYYVDGFAVSTGGVDQVGNGQGKLAYDDSTQLYTCELLFPFTADPAGEDGNLTTSSRYNVVIYDHAQPALDTGNAVGVSGIGGLGSSTDGWDDIPLVAAEPHDHSEIPAGLPGLIVYLSDHETDNGEIYAYEPLTGLAWQITDEPGLWKGSVSLSHDLTRVAFHGTNNPGSPGTYEIYVANVDGTGGVTALTTDGFEDRNPTWSPDDMEIAYQSERGGTFSVIVMQDDGFELADLTPDGDDDADPRYLLDGRILFKTDTFGDGLTSNERRIAVMNADGSNVIQLSATLGVSDHQPSGATSMALFTRFPKDTNPETDVAADFVSWPLVEIGLDGASESELLEDGWRNWLPVVDPSGEYIMYLKTQGYTDVHLATRAGEEIGRLVPNQTDVRYADWK
ncbi:MAG: hypothetical protein AAF682_31545 [Planctomycetota bacterium]